MFFVSRARQLALVAATVVCETVLCAGDYSASARSDSFPTPPAEPVTAVLEGWHRAEAYASAHPGCEVFVGRGDSMLPLYRDRTVLVVRTVAMKDLRPGMTVVFTGDRGFLVAHTLLDRTLDGWRAIGAGNREPDQTRVRRTNLVGVVVKAYATPLPGAVVALQ
jgi:hypothetical protein